MRAVTVIDRSASHSRGRKHVSRVFVRDRGGPWLPAACLSVDRSEANRPRSYRPYDGPTTAWHRRQRQDGVWGKSPSGVRGGAPQRNFDQYYIVFERQILLRKRRRNPDGRWRHQAAKRKFAIPCGYNLHKESRRAEPEGQFLMQYKESRRATRGFRSASGSS